MDNELDKILKQLIEEYWYEAIDSDTEFIYDPDDERLDKLREYIDKLLGYGE